MYDYMRALEDRFTPSAGNTEQRQEFEAKRQAVAVLLNKQGKKKLLRLVDQSIETFRDVELCEDSRMTLAQWLDRWLDEYAAPRLRESTMSSYRMYAEQYIKPRLGGKKMTSITTADIQRMYTKLKKEGRVHEHPKHGHQLSANTVRRIHAMLHRAMADTPMSPPICRSRCRSLLGTLWRISSGRS